MNKCLTHSLTQPSKEHMNCRNWKVVNSNKSLIHGTNIHRRILHYIMGEFKEQINCFRLCYKMESTCSLACQDSSDLGHMKNT